MFYGDSKPSLLSLLGGSPTTAMGGDTRGALSPAAKQDQQERSLLREMALDRYFPQPQQPDTTGLLPLLQILAHGAVPAPPMGSVQMPPPEMPQQGMPGGQQPGAMQ